MATTSQLIRAPRRTQAEKTKVPALGAAPQKRGVCTRVYTTTPKPTRRRKMCRVRLVNGYEVTTSVWPQPQGTRWVLIRGPRQGPARCPLSHGPWFAGLLGRE